MTTAVKGNEETKERARLARKAANEAEAQRQLANSVHLSPQEQLENYRAEYAASKIPVLFFEKSTNPQYLTIRGKKTLISMNVPTEDVFALPLDGCHVAVERINQYERKGWPIVGHMNLDKVEQTKAISDVRAHLRAIEVYKNRGQVPQLDEVGIKPAPVTGSRRKLSQKQHEDHEEVLPKPVLTPSPLQKQLEALEEEFGEDDGSESVEVVETKENGQKAIV